MKVTFKALFLSSMIVIPIACGNSNNSSSVSPTPGKVSLLEPSAEFKSYWFNGQAEISSYKLTQARYGELREGKAVMVFVTEPFSLSKWVKLDQPESNPEDKVDVLKLNFTRNFETGIYPYSLLTSVFSPINGRKSMKINNSCQEWCGHTFAQLKLVNDQYDWLLHSYFETENEESYSIQNSISEDDIWTKIRINPELLPVGEFQMIPALHFLRFKHLKARDYKAEGKLAKNESVYTYTIEYKDINRKVEIIYHAAFPFQIQSWTETYPDGWGDNPALLTTVGKLEKSILSDYWSKNSNADSLLRRELGF